MRPQGKVFLLFSNEELEYCIWKEALTPDYLFCQTEKYSAYGFESYEEMISVLSRYAFRFDGSSYVYLGEDDNGQRTLHDGGDFSSPWQTFYQGGYEICIEGTDVDQASYQIVFDYGEETLPLEVEKTSSEEVVLRFDCSSDCENGQLRVANSSGADIVYSSMAIRGTAS